MRLAKFAVVGFIAMGIVSNILFINGTTTTKSPPPMSLTCPTKLRIETTALGFIDIGWSGLAHNKTLGIGMASSYDVRCPQVVPGQSCGKCEVSGPVADPKPGAKNLQRCTLDTNVTCDSDDICSKKNLGVCRFFMGGPMPLTTGGIGYCGVTYFEPNHKGIIDVSTVTGQFSKFGVQTLLSPLSEAPESLLKPCPLCLNSVCTSGVRKGLKCEVHATFPDGQTTSLDCAPKGMGTNKLKMDLAPIGTQFAGTSQSEGWATRTLSSESPNCSAYGYQDKKCFTGICSHDKTLGCFNNGDCGTGNTCTNSGYSNKPNDCGGDNLCVPGYDGMHGQCDNGSLAAEPYLDSKGIIRLRDVPRYCYPHSNSNSTTKSGETNYSVVTYAEPNRLVNNKANITFGSLFAAPPAIDSGMNLVIGLPALGRISQKAEASLFFSHNCPMTQPTCEPRSAELTIGPKGDKMTLKMTGNFAGTNKSLFGDLTQLSSETSLCVYDAGNIYFGKTILGGGNWKQNSKAANLSLPSLNEGRWKVLLNKAGIAISGTKIDGVPQYKSGLTAVVVSKGSNRCWSGVAITK